MEINPFRRSHNLLAGAPVEGLEEGVNLRDGFPDLRYGLGCFLPP